MRDKEKKECETALRESRDLEEVLKQLPSEVAEQINHSQQRMLIADMIQGITNALIDNQVLTKTQLDKAGIKAIKQRIETMAFLRKLKKGV